jgi:hypothetical protein
MEKDRYFIYNPFNTGYLHAGLVENTEQKMNGIIVNFRSIGSSVISSVFIYYDDFKNYSIISEEEYLQYIMEQ